MVLCKLCAESVEKVHVIEMKTRIQGVVSQMTNFKFFLGVSHSQMILCYSDNLSWTLQC